ncbi:GlxA family transcriptional regulator [Enteractinococcus helveticum]|uniref:GlxA family transcriptional regulator n=1 Tax=Enteractinococcus helveticum TaxID=1837282 RepID=UPI0009EE9D19|nr:helix-turn-helix domain-containing protein [Enteractinococcus helveticum]
MRITIHAFDGMTMFHLSTPLAVFGEVTRSGLAEWETTVFSDDGEPIHTAEGLQVAEIRGPEAADDADLLVFPSWPIDLPPAEQPLIDMVRATQQRGATVAGLCLGTFPVAHSGLLDGRTAVTHWLQAEALMHQAPNVDVRPGALYIDHGDVLTSAGTASALDACLHLVRSRLGAEAATAVARRLVIAPHRDGGQAQYIQRPVVDEADAQGPIGEVMDWALHHLDQPLTIETLAEQVQMSPRNFSRRFREYTGVSPAKWVLARRLDESRRLLETTELPISEVATACGFSSPVTFRQNFVTAYDTTPTAYRQHFSDVECTRLPEPPEKRDTGLLGGSVAVSFR